MAFDPSIIASTLGTVAGAYLAPGDHRLGAQIGGALASAAFPSAAEKQDQKYNALRLSSLETSIAHAKENQELQRTQAEQQNILFNRQTQEHRRNELERPELKERQTKLYEQEMMRQQTAIDANVYGLEVAKQNAAMVKVEPHSLGGKKVGQAMVAQAMQDANGGIAPTPAELNQMASNPEAMALVNMQSALHVLSNTNMEDPDERLAASRHVSMAGFGSKYDAEKKEFVILDGSGLFDKDGDGKITPYDVKMIQQELTKGVASEYKINKMHKQMASDPKTATVGAETIRLTNAYAQSGDPAAGDTSTSVMEGIIAEVSKGAVAASGFLRKGNLLITTNPEMLPELEKEFDDLFGDQGFDGYIDPSSGQLFVRIARASEFFTKNAKELEAVDGSLWDQHFMSMPSNQLIKIVDGQVTELTTKAIPPKNDVLDRFNGLTLSSGTVRTADSMDGKKVIPGEDVPVGQHVRQEFFKRFVELTGNDKPTMKELKDFQNSVFGQAAMAEITADATRRMVEREQQAASGRQTATEKRNAEVIDAKQTAIKGGRGSSEALASVAVGQAAARAQAGGQPSILLPIAKKKLEDEKAWMEVEGNSYGNWTGY